MNVTLKLDDQLCREARHRAVDAGLSLSGWMTVVLRRELGDLPPEKPVTLLEALGNEALADYEIGFPRDRSIPQPPKFT